MATSSEPCEPLARRLEKRNNGRVSEFLQRVEATVNQRRLLPRGSKILVAVSGGADSLVLLYALHALAPKYRWQISIAHFNHQLRGRASAADEKLVEQTSVRLHLKFFGGRADVKKFAAQSKISIEMAARKLRHDFLATTARAQKTPAIALAHHADDQVELFFLRLLRGAGGEGLAGMKWCSPSPAHKTISLIRPLLDCSKSELVAFAREQKIRFRDDATNYTADILRNRIRNELLPLLQSNYQPGLMKTVLRLMEIVGAETDFVGQAASRWLARSKTKFAQLPVPVQRRVIQAQLTQLGLLSDFDLIEQLRLVAEKPVSVRSDLAIVRNTAGKVIRCEPLENRFNPDTLTLKLSARNGQTEFAGRNFRWRLTPQRPFRHPLPKNGVEFFDAAKVGGEIMLRHWRAGDRFQPIGLKSAVKLQDLFVNAKIPAAQRRKLVLATTVAGEIFWVEGLRIGEQFKLTPDTKRRFRWDFESSPAVVGTR